MMTSRSLSLLFSGLAFTDVADVASIFSMSLINVVAAFY